MSPPAERLDTFTIALTDSVDLSHARPVNDSERLAFRNMRADLLRVDCQGDLRPGIIHTWTADSPGTLTLTLEIPSHTSMSGLMSAAAVAASLAPGGEAKTPGIDSAVVLNDRQLRLFTTASLDTVLRALADPGLAVPEGIPMQGPERGKVLDLGADQPALQLRLPPLGDPRDALDRGADLIVTRDPALLEYAARRPEFTVHPLPWSRTYILVQPAPAPSLTSVTTAAERQALARDAVPADARGAEPPYWWLESSCPATEASTVPPASDRIVYLREDEVARALTERLVALAGPGSRLRATGLEQPQLTAALRQGSERAYVVSLPTNPLQPCRELRGFPAGARTRPLIDTRAHAIVRQGAPPLSVDWDGAIRVVRP